VHVAVVVIALLAYFAGRRLRKDAAPKAAAASGPLGNVVNLLSNGNFASTSLGSAARAARASLSAHDAPATTSGSSLTHYAASRSGAASLEYGTRSFEACTLRSGHATGRQSREGFAAQGAACASRGSAQSDGGTQGVRCPGTLSGAALASASTDYAAAVSHFGALDEDGPSAAAASPAQAGPSAHAGGSSQPWPAAEALAEEASEALPESASEGAEAVQGALHEHELQVQTMLGRGGFGTVYYGARLGLARGFAAFMMRHGQEL
jgi:hypothetical protein